MTPEEIAEGLFERVELGEITEDQAWAQIEAMLALERRRYTDRRTGKPRFTPTLNPATNRFRAKSPIHNAAWEKTYGVCCYCESRAGFHLEHKVPVSRGGETSFENCVVSCQSCNSRKGSMTADEYRIHLMLTEGRPPEEFYGEKPRSLPWHKRDWLIICSPHIIPPPARQADRIAAHLGTGA